MCWLQCHNVLLSVDVQGRVELLEAENIQLRSVSSDSSNILRDRALYAAQQINAGALDAEQMLK